MAKLAADGTLNHGPGRSLINKLENAQRKVQSGQPGPAESIIQAFIQQVQDLAADGILTAEQAAALIADAPRRDRRPGPRSSERSRKVLRDIEAFDVA